MSMYAMNVKADYYRLKEVVETLPLVK